MSDTFIEKIAPIIQQYESPLFNSVSIAQAVLESNHGQSELAREAYN